MGGSWEGGWLCECCVRSSGQGHVPVVPQWPLLQPGNFSLHTSSCGHLPACKSPLATLPRSCSCSLPPLLPCSPYQLSILGDYADRGTASGVVRADGTACWTMSASQPTLACQGVPLGGTLAMTADNKFVTLAGYDLPAGTPVVAPGNVASTMQNLSLPAASVNRVLAAVDLTSGAQSIAVNVNAFTTAAVTGSTSRVPYPCEITGAVYWKNASDASGNSGTWYTTTGWGTSSAGTTGTVWVPKADGLSAKGADGGLIASVLTTGIGLPGNGGLIALPATAGITSAMASTGTGGVVGYGAGGSAYYVKYMRSPKVYNNYLYYALVSKGIYVCLNGVPAQAGNCSAR